MKRLALALMLWILFAAGAVAADLSGSWGLEFQSPDSHNVYSGECAFRQEGERLAGSCGSGPTTPVPVRGTVRGREVTFEFKTGIDAGLTLVFSGQLDDKEASLTGSWTSVDQDGGKGGGTFQAVRR
jgi:hypothetical protein